MAKLPAALWWMIFTKAMADYCCRETVGYHQAALPSVPCISLLVDEIKNGKKAFNGI